MVGKIIRTSLIWSVDPEEFHNILEDNINTMQERGLEVEIQYSISTTGLSRHNALILGRQRIN